MDTLGLVSTNHDVAEGPTFLDEEDSIRVATLRLFTASSRPPVVAGERLGRGEGLARSHGDRLAQRRGSWRRREDIGRGAALQATKNTSQNRFKSPRPRGFLTDWRLQWLS
jgi:hypothetical protein